MQFDEYALPEPKGPQLTLKTVEDFVVINVHQNVHQCITDT